MALDFSNRDPKDANGIYSLDTTGAAEAWVKDGDWSQVYYSQTEARKAGANNKIKVATAITNDGKKYDVVIGADGNPISQIGDTKGQDDDRARAWAQTAPKPLPPGASPTQRQPDGSINSYNPVTGVYDTPTGQTAATTAQRQEWQPEGTPDSSGGYDNSKPIMAEYVNGKRTGRTRVPTGDELKDWNEAQQRSRNPGGKSDAEAAAEKDKQAANAARPGTKIKSTTEVRNGKSVTVETWRLPDGTTEERIAEEPVKPDKEEILQGRGPNGEDVRVVRDSGGKVVRYEPIEGGKPAGLPAGLPQFRPDFNHPDGGWGLIDYSNQLLELESLGKLTPKQRAELIQQAHNATTATAGRLDTIRAQQQQLQSNEINQRNTDAQVSSQRLNSANAATNDALTQSMKMAGAHTPDSYAKGGGAILPAIMALQAQNAAAYGGMNQPARVGTQGYPVLNQLAGQTIPAIAALTAPPPSRAAVDAQNAAVVPATSANLGRLAQPPAAGPAPAPLLPPSQPVAAPSPAAGPQAPVTAPGPAQPKIRFRNVKTGEIREMAPMELDAMPDVADWQPVDPSAGSDVFTPQQGNPQAAAGADQSTTPIFSPQQGNPQQAATPSVPGNPDYQPGMPPGSSITPYQPPVNIPYPDNAGAQSMMQPGQRDPRMAQMSTPDGGPPPMPGAYYPVDPRPAPTYDREGIDRTNDPLMAPRAPVEPWPNLRADPGAMTRQQPQTLPAVNNMTWIGNVMGQRPHHASEADWQAAVRQAAAEMGIA